MSGAGERRPLTIPSIGHADDLEDFRPRQSTGPAPCETKRSVDASSGFPSRDARADAQLNLKGPQHILERFKALCKADRRPYYDMLEILMDTYQDQD